MAKIFKPRRGKKSTMAGTKKTTVLSAGEMFIEVPDTGAGTGHSKMKIGDGSTQYSSLPYAMGDTENDKIAFSNDTSGNITTALNKVTSGAALKTMIAALKQAVSLANTSITQLNDETNSINSALANKADTNHWHASMKCRGTNHWFSAEWKNSSLQLWIDETNVFDTANFRAGVDTLYNKCVSCGSTPSSKTPTAISNAIQSIYTNRYNAGVSATKKGNATASQVLDGRTFTNSSSVGIEGTMPNRGNLNWSSSNTTKTVSAGYYSGGTLDSRPSYNNGRTQGQNDVKNNPNRYGLYNKTQYDQNYTNGYNAGKSAGQSDVAGSYNISFTINARGGDNGSNWMKYTDQITINVSKSGVPTLGSPSFMNAQIRSEYGESYRLTKK